MKKNIPQKKRSITLVEIMIVMLLIGMITGTMAYNYKKSLDRGKEFKTKEIISRVEAALNMALAEGEITPTELNESSGAAWKAIIAKSPLVKSQAPTNAPSGATSSTGSSPGSSPGSGTTASTSTSTSTKTNKVVDFTVDANQSPLKVRYDDELGVVVTS
ncbi:MAG: putative outer membrane protein [Chlamydiia bacterium]|nr:putative outer membrane protein [Chlamydiia bacterium]